MDGWMIYKISSTEKEMSHVMDLPEVSYDYVESSGHPYKHVYFHLVKDGRIYYAVKYLDSAPDPLTSKIWIHSISAGAPTTLNITTLGDYDSIEYSIDGGITYSTYSDGFIPPESPYNVSARLKIGDHTSTAITKSS